MELSRRSFLRGFVAVSAAAIVPVTVADMALPRIVGDGIHDDIKGINAALRGDAFACPSAIVSREADGTVVIRGGNFYLSESIRLPRSGHAFIDNCRIRFADSVDGFFVSPEGADSSSAVTHCWFTGGRSAIRI